jgi:hypothetical protein
MCLNTVLALLTQFAKWILTFRAFVLFRCFLLPVCAWSLNYARTLVMQVFWLEHRVRLSSKLLFLVAVLPRPMTSWNEDAQRAVRIGLRLAEQTLDFGVPFSNAAPQQRGTDDSRGRSRGERRGGNRRGDSRDDSRGRSRQPRGNSRRRAPSPRRQRGRSRSTRTASRPQQGISRPLSQSRAPAQQNTYGARTLNNAPVPGSNTNNNGNNSGRGNNNGRRGNISGRGHIDSNAPWNSRGRGSAPPRGAPLAANGHRAPSPTRSGRRDPTPVPAQHRAAAAAAAAAAQPPPRTSRGAARPVAPATGGPRAVLSLRPPAGFFVAGIPAGYRGEALDMVLQTARQHSPIMRGLSMQEFDLRRPGGRRNTAFVAHEAFNTPHLAAQIYREIMESMRGSRMAGGPALAAVQDGHIVVHTPTGPVRIELAREQAATEEGTGPPLRAASAAVEEHVHTPSSPTTSPPRDNERVGTPPPPPPPPVPPVATSPSESYSYSPSTNSSDVAKTAINDLCARYVATPNGGAQGVKCNICLMDVAQGEAMVRLPCLHFFHDACVTRAFKECLEASQDMKCPECRTAIQTRG